LPSEPGVTTDLLRAIDAGDEEAAERLVPLVYAELKRIAKAQMRRLAPGQTLQTTALVHEAWIRLSAGESRDWSSRAHYFGAAANAMRQVLIDETRRKRSAKRGGDRQRVTGAVLEGIGLEGPPCDLLDLDDALRQLEEVSPRKVQIVALRFFAGLSMAEVAEILDVPLRTVEREWRFARAWLQARLQRECGGEAG
jgi:RNA polymerase sigma factor (TIGR02999 family)